MICLGRKRRYSRYGASSDENSQPPHACMSE
ncbi:Uncharacterised protein [Bordetella pertussis]|nr:Uncharacterised protein [Bordetella pertussis]CFW47291.1 Uncharacterised protein [Bordetella pertussis]